VSENGDKKNLTNNQYWFYKWSVWVRLLLCILFFPIFIPILIWPIIKLKKPIKIGLTVIWTIIMLFWLGSGSSVPDKIVLNVSGVSEGEVIKSDRISVKIKTDPLTLDEVTVNGESASKKGLDIEYSFERQLPNGNHKIKIVGKKGNKISEKEFSFKIDQVAAKQENISKSIASASLPKTMNYKIEKEGNTRYDKGKEYLVLIEEVNLKSDFKDKIKDIIRQIVKEKGKKISVVIFDNPQALDLYYNTWVRLAKTTPDTPQEKLLKVRHNIASFSGELETGLYFNTLSFFDAGVTGDLEELDSLRGTVEFNTN
jgi:hypothetical protein